MKINKNNHPTKTRKKIVRYSVGIDEVGRGSLAGPLFVSAAAIPANLHFGNSLKDSKKLSPKQRAEWFKKIKSHPGVTFAISRIYPRAIEKKNVSRAANLAALRAFKRLTSNFQRLTSNTSVFLDGGLYLGNGRQRILKLPHRSALSPRLSATTVVKTVVKGDEKIPAIKIASIIAKVSRDRTMVRLAKKYPQYKFEVHKGYGTKRHIQAIKKFGPSKIHRLTFLSKYSSIK